MSSELPGFSGLNDLLFSVLTHAPGEGCDCPSREGAPRVCGDNVGTLELPPFEPSPRVRGQFPAVVAPVGAFKTLACAVVSGCILAFSVHMSSFFCIFFKKNAENC